MSRSRLTCPASPSALRAGATQGILLRSKNHIQVGLSLLDIFNPPKLPSASERIEGGWCARRDSNAGPSAPEADALSGLSYGRKDQKRLG
jgi:hypothetical protein